MVTITLQPSTHKRLRILQYQLDLHNTDATVTFLLDQQTQGGTQNETGSSRMAQSFG